MAQTTATLLETAGIAEVQYGSDVSVSGQNRSVMFNKVRRWIFPPGQTLSIPKMTARATTTTASQTGDLTYAALAGTKSAMTNTFAYNGIDVTKQALNAMGPDRLNMLLMAQVESAGIALGNDMDSDLLGQYASYTATTVAAATGVVLADLRQMITEARTANAPLSASRGFYIVLHENEWDFCDNALDDVNQSRADVDFPADDSTGDFIYRKTVISCTGNVPISTNRRGVYFSGNAFGLAIRNQVEIDEGFDMRSGSRKMLISSDYAYDIPHPEWAGQVTGQTA